MASSSSSETSKPNWLELPRNVMASILSRLPANEVLRSAQLVCKEWLAVAMDPLVWRRVEIRCDSDTIKAVEFQNFFCIAVNRSCGQVVDVDIENICTDALLHYLTQRATKIKRLRIARPYKISRTGLLEAVVKLPLLEEIEFSKCRLDQKSIEALGRSCPHLKSFKLGDNYKDVFFVIAHQNEDAIAIGRSMPGLRHLAMKGNMVDQKGVEAILRECPHLKSLDLRGCFVEINKDEEVWRRCTEQVKNLQATPCQSFRYRFWL